MTTFTPIFGITEMAAAQAQPNLVFNEAMRFLEALAQLGVTSRAVADPPSEIVDGDRYIVAGGATTLWSDHVDHIAIGMGGQWKFVAPFDGFEAWVVDEAKRYRFRSGSPSGWQEIVYGGGGGSGVEALDAEVADAPAGPTEDDYNPAGWSAGAGGNVLRITPPGGGLTLTGISSGSFPSGQLALISNESSAIDITCKHEDAGSTAANRFFNAGSGDVVIPGYSVRAAAKIGNRWRIL